ncbi:hypothetical protein C7408_13121 [Paraburkholderia caballeronis]|nr:hypothetical protein C7408_13121 [Paraburkholderia caballeronis]TDV07902.1 hypothetical protein C7406_13321 [Paraburkholderia caballeronis]TDV18193.1 hypothetical protein C7404_13121 [Paraburkholderia caballeronis]
MRATAVRESEPLTSLIHAQRGSHDRKNRIPHPADRAIRKRASRARFRSDHAHRLSRRRSGSECSGFRESSGDDAAVASLAKTAPPAKQGVRRTPARLSRSSCRHSRTVSRYRSSPGVAVLPSRRRRRALMRSMSKRAISLPLTGSITNRRLRVVTRLRAFDSSAVQLWPQQPPVMGALVFARNRAIRRKLKTDTVLRAWRTISIGMAPLPQLRVAFDPVAKRSHSDSQLGHGESTGRREVFVEGHGRKEVANAPSIGAFATHIKHRSLWIARATLQP